MNQEFLNALINWSAIGRRCVDIKFDNQIGQQESKVWCYDYDLEIGVIVISIEEIPTTEQLKQDKRESIQSILDSL